jgi:hypothetical protein
MIKGTANLGLVTAAGEDFGFGEGHEFLIISNANQQFWVTFLIQEFIFYMLY